MLGKKWYQDEDASYLLQYEKKKMRECAGTLEHLATAFLAEEEESEENEKDRQVLLWKRRYRESRVMLADHLREMAGLIQKTANQKVQIIRLGEKKERQLAKMLLLEGLVLEDIYLLDENRKGKKVAARLSQTQVHKKDKLCSVEEAADYLSVLLDMRLVPAADTPFFILEEPGNFYFEEDMKYMVLTGYAKAVKEGEHISGDNYAFFETGEREFFGILSDGMGSGEKACKDSDEVLEMAEKFLEAGFSKELTIQMINNALLASGEGRNMSTLDMCSIDLHTGEALVYKVGAAHSFLKRDSFVEKLPSVSLPLGVFQSVEMNHFEKKLLHGDYMILCSDGILDCFPGQEGEEFLMQSISQMSYQRPAEIANYLLRHAIAAGQGEIKDDMTVLVLGVWENAGGN